MMRGRSSLLTAACAACACAAGVLVTSVWRAAVLEPLPAPSAALDASAIASISPAPSADGAAIIAAIAAAPFDADRLYPEQRIAISDIPVEVPQGGEAMLHLVGTVVLPGTSGVALCRWGAEEALIVRIGERCGDFTLRRVTADEAEFATAGGPAITIPVSESEN